MDWKYLLSVSPKDISDETKDELCNTIAWYDCDDGELDLEKAIVIIKISQEIMKYKSEQVEVLMAEMDEIATKQGEEEARRDELKNDVNCIKSKKSSSLDLDDLEIKYRNLKINSKKMQKILDTTNAERDKLKQTIQILEQKNIHLQQELQFNHHDESSSDISEAIKDQQKDLIENINQKNSHISQLLMDIEAVERDNLILRQKLTIVRDELCDATEKLKLATEKTKADDLKMEETLEILNSLKISNETLKITLADLDEDRKQRELEFEKFTKEIDVRIDNWNTILEEKNAEISHLKSQISLSKSPSHEILPEDEIQLKALNKAIAQREEQIVELRKQLQFATKEMEESSLVMERFNIERDSYVNKLEKLNSFAKDLKKQLKNAHNRCQELQEDVKYQEELSEMRECDLMELVDKLERNQGFEVKELLKQIQELKTQKKFKEKQISDLVRTCNKLQSLVESLEKENAALREKLGLTEDDFVSTKHISSVQRKQKKELEQLKKENLEMEEERIELRLEVKQLSKIISSLSDQIIDFGETPITQNKISKEKKSLENIAVEEKMEEAKKRIQTPKEEVSNEQYSDIIKENESLKKFIHEIFSGVAAEKEIQEIKFENFEKLLKTFKVKHVSDCYHSTTRLQDELHALQSSNSELREQLRITREELQRIGDQEKNRPINYVVGETNKLEVEETSSNALAFENINKHLSSILKNYQIEEETNGKLIEKLEKYKIDFEVIQEQVSLLYKQYLQERDNWNIQYAENNRVKTELEEKALFAESKLSAYTIYTNPQTEEETKISKSIEMAGDIIKLNRKCVYLENQETEYRNQIDHLRNDLLNSKKAMVIKINKLQEANSNLMNKIEQLECQQSVSRDNVQLQNDYDNLLVKERQLLFAIDEIRNINLNEIDMLNKKVDLLLFEKKELEKQLIERFSRGKCDSVSKKLAQSEMNEITERQRANHINSLYELVKEQLQKSEDRCKEYQKCNKEIMHKNLILQESAKELEDKIVYFVDVTTYKNLEAEYVKLMDKFNEVLIAKNAIQNEYQIVHDELEAKKLWSNLEQYELLALKHQIVDLQSSCDDKSVIARLSSDVVLARISQAETNRKLEETVVLLQQAQDQVEYFQTISNSQKKRSDSINVGMEKKIKFMETIIKQQRYYYYGFVPFISEMKFIENILEIYKDKKQAREYLLKVEAMDNELKVLKDSFDIKIRILEELKEAVQTKDTNYLIENWYQEKTNLQLQELRYKKYSEFKESQLQKNLLRLNSQEEHIAKLECELLQSLSIKEPDYTPVRHLKTTSPNVIEIKPEAEKKIKTEETQTIDMGEVTESAQKIIRMLEDELKSKTDDLENQVENIQHMKTKMIELEMNLSLLRQQIGDKQSQINFYEKHILEMQKVNDKKEIIVKKDVNEKNNETADVQVFKKKIRELQMELNNKNEALLKSQSVIKKDRDEHSLAAARFQEELQQLQANLLSVQEKKVEKGDIEVKENPGRAAIEQYILQVHALEKHTAELHTTVTSLKSQLQSSRQEAVRWRTLANERLEEMDILRLNLDEQHQSELQVYKEHSEKWKEEVKNMQVFINKYKRDVQEIRPDIEKELKDKENKINDLSATIRQLRRLKSNIDVKEENVEEMKENLMKEQDILKKRVEHLLHKEKIAREEIKNLKGQLAKRSTLSAKSDTVGTKEQQLQKKINSLEKEISELKAKLEKEIAVNELHKIKVSQDFVKWNKQKIFQQTAEKLKMKLKEKANENDKLQQTCSGYRILIERLEREKHNLESRIKNLKTNSTNCNIVRNDMLQIENGKLRAEVVALMSKLDMQQHHSGALSAAMLQEKLQGQERKIAILEMSSKGGGELRAEMERLQTTNSSLQKSNLRLEAENLELRLDLEKSHNELPHLREQIVHLENYIAVLKTENAEHEVSNSGDHVAHVAESKRIPELERTVFVLKRIVEKLQVENKRLLTGSRPCSDSSTPVEWFRKENKKLKEQYGESLQKIAQLEEKLVKNVKYIAIEELENQLRHKEELLEKVKELLNRAAAKEKKLLEQVASLKEKNLCNCKK